MKAVKWKGFRQLLHSQQLQQPEEVADYYKYYRGSSSPQKGEREMATDNIYIQQVDLTETENNEKSHGKSEPVRGKGIHLDPNKFESQIF